MLLEIGNVEAIFRYPVKSMGGERLEVAESWAGTASMVTDAWHSGGLMTAAGSRGYQQARFPTCSCLLHTAVRTVLREIFLRIFARRMAKRCLSSGMTWPRRSHVGTGLPCR